jgi:long-chain acyl-CoA synthetase
VTETAAAELLRREFATVADLIRAHARAQPDSAALIHAGRSIDYAALDRMMDRVAAALQRDGLRPCDTVAICGATSIEYVAIFLGCLRAGVAVAPLATTYSPRTFSAMVADAGAKALFLDENLAGALSSAAAAVPTVLLDAGSASLQRWLAKEGSVPAAAAAAAAAAVRPDWPFNVIYSSGTTGMPKGIVQPHAFRWANVQRAALFGYGPASVVLLATPLYSNLTLATLFGVLSLGGSVVMLARFDAERYLVLAHEVGATHTMLVPVQYQRLLAHENFGNYDLSSFAMKFSTGAPFAAALKDEVLRRWPGGLIEIYAMTEGGGASMLEAHKFPGKLHTVGTPMPRNELRIIDAAGREVAAGTSGEIVGHSPAMMTGYLNQPSMTAAAQWYDSQGRRFIRTGDIGCMDHDGFLVLLDRQKDLIISGGFNVYPSDLEAVLREHPAIEEAAVVGVASARWGETPVACVVLKGGADLGAAALTAWANQRLGKLQRIASVRIVSSLPRNEAGKVLKRALRDAIAADA